MTNYIILYIFAQYFLIINSNANSMGYCEKITENDNCESQKSHFLRKRYILYEVNPAEGFNLRRDVYIRVSTFIKHIIRKNKHYQWNLVLPPWGTLYHWKSMDVGVQKQLSWKTFFDIESMKKYIPVLEMDEFIMEYPVEHKETVLDHVYFLKNDDEMFKTGNFKKKNIVIDCPKNGIPYKKRFDGKFRSFFWGYLNITTSELKCIIFHGSIFDLETNLYPNIYRTVMFDRMEIPLHHSYGSVEYWKARRSMRYNSHLYQIANEFRSLYLNSNDLNDNIHRPEDWRSEKRKRNAIGGPYLGVHFRRQDFLIGHAATLPTIETAAFQIKKSLKFLKLDTVFIATDADEKEYIQLKNKLSDYNVVRFIPTKMVKETFKDGGIAIIDQIICSHSRYFIGTHESTFTYRIQEDREILGFPVNTTFNILCMNKNKCSFASRWEIVWD